MVQKSLGVLLRKKNNSFVLLDRLHGKIDAYFKSFSSNHSIGSVFEYEIALNQNLYQLKNPVLISHPMNRASVEKLRWIHSLCKKVDELHPYQDNNQDQTFRVVLQNVLLAEEICLDDELVRYLWLGGLGALHNSLGYSVPRDVERFISFFCSVVASFNQKNFEQSQEESLLLSANFSSAARSLNLTNIF